MNPITIPTSEEFLAQVHLFRKKMKMSKTMFSRQIANDVSFLIRMQAKGKTLTLKRANHIQRKMIEYETRCERKKAEEIQRVRDIKSMQR